MGLGVTGALDGRAVVAGTGTAVGLGATGAGVGAAAAGWELTMLKAESVQAKMSSTLTSSLYKPVVMLSGMRTS